MTTENETQTNEEQQCNSKLTTVKTIYARAAILLLAANFCLTGYCLVKLSENQQEVFDTSQGISGATAVTKKESQNLKSLFRFIMFRFTQMIATEEIV